jgi:hypothetical protein
MLIYLCDAVMCVGYAGIVAGIVILARSGQ